MTYDDALTTPDAQIPQAAIDTLAGAEWITVFTGAGMSADSGVPTFRDAQTGLWENFDAEQLATPQAFNADPALVWGWYQWRAHLVRQAAPNAGHLALSTLAEPTDEADDAPSVMVVTQNVDDLHERAGNTVVSHLHGSLFAPRCSRCEPRPSRSRARTARSRSSRTIITSGASLPGRPPLLISTKMMACRSPSTKTRCLSR